MSEAYVAADDAPADEHETEFEAARDADAAGEADDAEAGDEEPGDEEAGEAKRKPKDPEKEIHNLKGATARERSRRRAAETLNRELQERLERLERSRETPERDELLEIIGSLSDDEEDPVGDIAAVKRALKAFRARQLETSEAETRQQANARQFEKLRTSMVESEADFSLDFPDYPDAATFYRKARTEELEDAGYAGKALQTKLAEDLFGVVRMAIEGGMDPAERVYNLAKRRGFKAGATSADKKLDVLKRAADAGRKPGGGAAAGAANPLSWDDVAKLDGPARDKAWAKLRDRERGRR